VFAKNGGKTKHTNAHGAAHEKQFVDDDDDEDVDVEVDSKCISASDDTDDDDDDDCVEEDDADDDAVQEEMTASLTSIEYLGAGLDGGDECDYRSLKEKFDGNPMKWVQIINFMVQLHYDIKNAPLKPNIVSLCAEYLAYLTNNGHLDELLSVQDEERTRLDVDVRRSVLIRMALFEAVKYDQGFQVNVEHLFQLSLYSKPMAFSNHADTCHSMNGGQLLAAPATKDEKALIAWLRVTEIAFCNKLQWKFAFSTRYQMLMTYLRRLGFDVDGIMSEHYKNIKIAFNQDASIPPHQRFDDNVKFAFLCRYLLEMTYYKAHFYGVTKRELAISIIYAAYIIALRWREKFNFNRILHAHGHDEEEDEEEDEDTCRLFRLLDGKHPSHDRVICELIKKVIRIGRAPHACMIYCTPMYADDGNMHYHRCQCVLNCCLNSYLKYSKTAFCEISKVPCLTTSNLTKFVQFMERKECDLNTSQQTVITPTIRVFASNKSVLQISK